MSVTRTTIAETMRKLQTGDWEPVGDIVIDDSKTTKQPATCKSYDEMTLERDIRKEVDRNIQFANERR
jgi:hypothetical protein